MVMDDDSSWKGAYKKEISNFKIHHRSPIKSLKFGKNCRLHEASEEKNFAEKIKFKLLWLIPISQTGSVRAIEFEFDQTIILCTLPIDFLPACTVEYLGTLAEM